MAETYSNIEIKVKGFLRTALDAEASTTTLDIDWVKEDDPNTAVTIQSDSLMFEIDPLGKTGKTSEICLSTSVAAHATVSDRTTHTTTVRGLTREGHEQTGAAARANSWDEGTEVGFATGSMAKIVNLLAHEVSEALQDNNEALQLTVYATTTTRDAAITAPSNGDMCYVTAEGTAMIYQGGIWDNIDTGAAQVNASTTVKGVVEIATVAEQGSAAAAGDTGAIAVPTVGNLVKTSSGAGDENKIAILDSAGAFADGFVSQSAVEQHLAVPLTTGENVTAGNALRVKIDGLAYKADEDPVQGMLREIITTSDSHGIAACQVDTDKIIYVYHVGVVLTGMVLTWDGEQYTAGAKVDIDANAGAMASDVGIDVVSHATNAFTVVQWDDAAAGVDDATAWACTVSGTTVTAGSPTVIDAGTQTNSSAHSICSPAAGKVTISYTDTADSKTNSITGTIATRTITFGAAVEVGGDSDEYVDVCEIGTDKVVTVYRDTDDDLYARVSTISTRTMTQGAALELEDGITLQDVNVAKVEDDKFVVMYYTGAAVKLIVCTVATTTITKGTPVSISTTRSSTGNVMYFSDDKVAILYKNDTYPDSAVGVHDYLPWSVGWVTTTATVPTVNQICRFDRTYNPLTGVTMNTNPIVKVNNDMVQVVATDGTGKDIYVANIADNNFIGYAASTVTSGSAVDVDLLFNDSQSSLTTGVKYYLADSGAIAATGIVPCGTAVSATTIIKE